MLINVLKSQNSVLFSGIFRKNNEEIELKTNPIVYSKSGGVNIKVILGQYLDVTKKVVLALSNKQQYETALEFLKSENLDFETLNVFFQH